MQIVMIPLDRIAVGPRLRQVDPAYARLIGESLRERGQDTPVRVMEADAAGMHRLVAGGHRVEAAISIGWTEIAATLFTGSDLQAEMAEIEENLMRAELSELDRAVFLYRHQQVWQALHPDTARRGPKAKANLANLAKIDADQGFFGRFDAALAETLDMSPRSIRRAVFRAAQIDPKVRAAISGLPVAKKGVELDALARLNPLEQGRVARALIDGARTVAEALRQVRRLPHTEPDADEATTARLESAWRKASAKVKRQFLQRRHEEGVLTAFTPREEVAA